MTGKIININLIIGVILSLLFVFISFSGVSVFEKIETGIYDLEASLSRDGRLNPDKIALVEIDDKSLEELGSWPWPRNLIAKMIDILNENGAELIGLNLPVDEVEHNEGLEEIRTFREKYNAYPAASADMSLKKWVLENLDQIEEKIDNDAILLNSIESGGNVILPVYPQARPDKIKTGDDAYLFNNAFNTSDISSRVKARVSKEYLLCPISGLGANSAGAGIVVSANANEAPSRSFPAYVSYKGAILPSFPLRLAASYLGLTPDDMQAKDNEILLKERSIPLSKGEMFIKFGKVERRYSFEDVLNNKDPGDDFKGKIVLIGLNLYNSRTLDMPGVMTDTQLNARLLDNIINSGTISRPPVMPYMEAVLILLTGIAVTFIVSVKSRIFRPVLASGLLLLIMGAGLLMLTVWGIWMRTACMAGCLVSVYLVFLVKDISVLGIFRRESPEEARMLGIDYQGKGLLDQAFNKFRKLPPDNESKELVYNLGLEYEGANRFDKALEVYEYISELGGYQDVEERIARLRLSDESAVTGTFERKDRGGIASDSGERTRSHVGRYEIINVLGKGSMGLVYKAQDPKINRLVAIKTMRFSDEFEEDLIQEIKERFFREAEIAGQLSHPAIVTIHDVGEDGDLTYMAMEFLEGQDLEKFITKGNLLPFRRALDIIAKTAEALDYAHKAKVIHRDIKPANIMMIKNGNIKVTDFGIAKAISSSRTKTGVILGTPNYMSPEQIMGQKIDARSDIFSLGVLFYQMITGELPFHGENLSALLYQITQIKHPSPRSYNPKVPGICEQILDKALAKNPDKRFRSAGEMARVINALGQRIDQLRIEKHTTK